LGLIIDKTLSWNQQVDQRATKVCSARYAIRNLKHIVPQPTVRTVYCAYIHSILSYSIIFWGRSSNVSKLFILQKGILGIINNTGVRQSCREAFKNMEIMTLYSEYIVFSINCILNTLYSQYIIFSIHCIFNTLYSEYIVFSIHCILNTLYSQYIIFSIHFHNNSICS
jgi:hypothetical protein